MSIISSHFNAVKARLSESAFIGSNVYDIARTNTDGGLVRANYLVLFGGPPDVLDDDRLAAPQLPDSEAEFVYTVRAVGTTPTAVRDWSDKALTQLVGHVPVVVGRSCGAIELDGSDPIQEDRGATPSLYYSDTDYLLRSSRA